MKGIGRWRRMAKGTEEEEIETPLLLWSNRKPVNV